MTIVFLVMKIEIVHNVEAFCAFFVFVLELFPLCKHNFPSIIVTGWTKLFSPEKSLSV